MEPRSSTPRRGAVPRPGGVILDDHLPDGPRPGMRVLRAVEDARTQAGGPDANLPTGFLWVAQPSSHGVFLRFDLSGIPESAQIRSAELKLTFTDTYPGSNDVEVGAVKGPWDAATLTWNTQPQVAWRGETQTVSGAGEVSWNVLPAVRAWVAGGKPNHGLALRGLGSVLKGAYSMETGVDDEEPRLVVVFTLPLGG